MISVLNDVIGFTTIQKDNDFALFVARTPVYKKVQDEEIYFPLIYKR